MALRWYTAVVDCQDVHAQARWWADVLGWQIFYEADDEVVIIPSWVTPAIVERTPWEQVGPSLVFVPVEEAKTVKNRLHIDLAPHISDDRDGIIDDLLAKGATRVEVGQSEDPGETTWTVLADPEGNEFCVLSSRER